MSHEHQDQNRFFVAGGAAGTQITAPPTDRLFQPHFINRGITFAGGSTVTLPAGMWQVTFWGWIVNGNQGLSQQVQLVDSANVPLSASVQYVGPGGISADNHQQRLQAILTGPVDFKVRIISGTNANWNNESSLLIVREVEAL